ncbi:hypothetical protein PIB30_083897 [Stylosanthes scabra]|uniref:Uncharacterized protein n=1 Tax=Stylosanthes scabra TaxID=79078 RepID=A0ABU6UR81_9FABA|nr:hypothetical protein [Stylosanthes scabra]
MLVGPPSRVAISSRGGVTVARAAVVSPPPWGCARSLVPPGRGTRLGSGTPPGRVPGQFEIRPNPFRRKVGGLAHSVQSDQRRFVYCLGLDSKGGGCPFWIPPDSVLMLPLPVASLVVALSYVEVIPTDGANVRNVPSRGLGLPA